MNNIINQYDEILPLASDWVKSQEELILKEGQMLPNNLRALAEQVGISCLEKVRFSVVNMIPRPENVLLEKVCEQKNFLSPDTAGLTLGYGIYIRSDSVNDKRLFIHELVHVLQYERLGGIEGFLKQYLFEILSVGYNSSPLEQEAINRTEEVCK